MPHSEPCPGPSRRVARLRSSLWPLAQIGDEHADLFRTLGQERLDPEALRLLAVETKGLDPVRDPVLGHRILAMDDLGDLWLLHRERLGELTLR
jgi:hypothetical protein